MFNSSKKKFLQDIRKEIEDLPWDIDDTMNENHEYKQEYLSLKRTVMHIRNRIRGYLILRYGEGNILLDEFMSYSFFTKGYVANPGNIANNNAWKSGKKSYLYFLDQLIDFELADEKVKSTDWILLCKKLCIFISILLISSTIIFASNEICVTKELTLNHMILIELFIFLLSMNIIWSDNWKDILPLTTTILGFMAGIVKQVFSM